MATKLIDWKHKISWTILLVSVLLLIVFPTPRRLVFENPIMGKIDSQATEYVNEALARAGAAFLLARTMNAVISVFQESELQLQPAGVGISVAFGQVLDPINDMVERFSWVMLASLTSLGIQKIIIQVGAWFSISIVLFFGLLFLLVDLWIWSSGPINFRRIGGTLVLLAFLIRFAVPGMAFLNNHVYETILKDSHDQSSSIIKGSVDDLSKFDSSDIVVSQKTNPDLNEENEENYLSKTKDLVSKTIAAGKKFFDLKSKYEAIKVIASGLFDHLINLIVVFVINTILLPMAFLWGFLKLFKLCVNQGFGEHMESFFKDKFRSNKDIERIERR